MFGRKERRATGIHFSGNALWVVELTDRGRKGIALHAAVVEKVEAPFDPVELDAVRNALNRALLLVWEQGKVDFERPCVALDYPAFLLKKRPLVVPASRRRRACSANQEHLRWEAGQFLGDQVGDFNLGCAILESYAFVVAVRRLVLDRYEKIFAQAQIGDLEFDIAPFALYNSAERAGILAEPGPVLLVQLEKWGAYALLVVDGKLRGVKRSSNKGDDPRTQLELLERCVHQVEEKVQQVWIAGNWTAGSPTTELGERLGVPCALFCPFAGFDSGAAVGQPESAFAVATGLAYRRLSE